MRKEIHDLTPEEWEKFAKAVNRLKDDGTWKEIAEAHVESMKAKHISHESAIFLPWHRKFQMEVENRLQMAMNDCSITIPYWNWALELPNFRNSDVWNSTMFGALKHRGYQSWRKRGCVQDGAFGSETDDSTFGKGEEPDVEGGTNDYSDCIVRDGQQMANMPYTELMAHLQQTDFNMTMFDYMSWFMEYNIHNAFHVAVGGPGSSRYSSSTGYMATMSSPFDPIFFLHHGFVDFLFQKWQDIHLVESDRWFHRQWDQMSHLLWDGSNNSFPATDVMHSMDILDDDPNTPPGTGVEKACVVYHDLKKAPGDATHACDAQWDRVRSCLNTVFENKQLGEVPRIKHMTSLGDVCSPLNPLEADLDRMWLENLAEMDMIEEQKVSEILKWEFETNTLANSQTPVLALEDASECDKALCFSTEKLLELCGA